MFGKPLNVEKARIDRVLGNDKLLPLITALGTSLGEEYDFSKLRYGKVIIMADADVDLASCLLSLDQVSTELRDLKALFSRQQGEQRTVLYVAIGVVILLLLFTAHSYSRLQYASDCMLHLRK